MSRHRASAAAERRRLRALGYTETRLVAECLAYLRARGVPCWRQNTGAAVARSPGGRQRFVRFGVPGVSDILGILAPRGRWLAVECKLPGGHVTPGQQAFLETVRKCGGVALLVTSVAELHERLAEAQ